MQKMFDMFTCKYCGKKYNNSSANSASYCSEYCQGRAMFGDKLAHPERWER